MDLNPSSPQSRKRASTGYSEARSRHYHPDEAVPLVLKQVSIQADLCHDSPSKDSPAPDDPPKSPLPCIIFPLPQSAVLKASPPRKSQPPILQTPAMKARQGKKTGLSPHGCQRARTSACQAERSPLFPCFHLFSATRVGGESVGDLCSPRQTGPRDAIMRSVSSSARRNGGGRADG